ncbi:MULTISPECIES: site-2 protease family protein [Cupriavidus]|uniref:site-2 protease family protein n=1 Tax=Cupriavidus TaxID=106589 RepID=UPI00157ACCE0|nr:MULTISPECIES: site-2 protease family protein [Cupriavidus]MBB1629399.1 peptidase M50 [Cupriavidus sp. UME77]MCP3024951.1 site-2 protease family protein [Cupriavidus basilensis]MDR3383304.1 site-2 protease family protein [Cupriavidus basilensis]NUA25617.1 site-2 protease family protein [Cupriavidus basilensis]
MDSSLIQTLAVYALPVLFAITLHEAAHGYVAKLFGDNTAYSMGRVSLNPARHIDPIGTIAVPLLLYFMTSGQFVFGYAKPVPVAFDHLRNPRWHGMWVALAGPGSNVLQAFLWALVAVGLVVARVQEPFFTQMAQAGVLVNLVMAAFNLFPVPPLDGGRVLTALLPQRIAHAVSRIEPYGIFVVLALVAAGVITKVWMQPVMGALRSLVLLMLQPILALVQ